MFGLAKIVLIFYYRLQDCGFLDATDSSKVISSHYVDFYLYDVIWVLVLHDIVLDSWISLKARQQDQLRLNGGDKILAEPVSKLRSIYAETKITHLC